MAIHKTLKAAILACLTALAGCETLSAPDSSPDEVSLDLTAPHYERPNIVLVLFEDMSPRVGVYGDPLARTPNFDRIAAEGVTYTRAFTTSGVCAPSRAALILGRHQMTTGTQHMRTHGYLGAEGGGPQDYYAVPAPEVKAFPELLRAAGYHATNNWKTDYQFGEPFTVWDASKDGADWRSREHGQAFFHMRTLLTTHESFVWPVDMPTSSRLEELVVARNQQVFADRVPVTDPAKVSVPPYLPDTPEVRRDLATHYDNIAFTDAQLGALYDDLEAEGLLDETILIVSTDHGDGLPRMKRSLYDSGLHVPFVIRYPDGWGAGTVETELVSFVDLAPTILSWAGVDIPEWMHGRDISGPDRDQERNHVFAAHDRIDTVMNHRRAVRDERFKYIRNYRLNDPYFERVDFRDAQPSMKALWAGFAAGTLPPAAEVLFAPLPEDQLYDTQSDPHEVENLAGNPDYAWLQAELEAALDDWLGIVGDMAAQPEHAMIEQMWPDGQQPQTQSPEVRIERDGSEQLVFLSSATPGASIGYRIGTQTPWKIYDGPLRLEQGKIVEAKAVRYGFEESPVISITL
ncbi:MAG: sulfatase [Henriciella sp.]|nr:sulfatase [Henriciella sp.]